MLGCSLLLMLAGCRSVTVSREDAATGVVSARYTTSGGEAQAPERWWRVFDSPELNALVDRALAGNLSITQAEARLRQAQASARKAGATLRPDLSLKVDAATSRRRAAVTQPDGGSVLQSTDSDLYGLGLAASYEVDLWGRVRSARDVAALSALGSREDLEAMAMTVAGEIVTLWLQQVHYRAQLNVISAQLENNRAALDLIRLRQRRSMATALDVYQQEQIVAATEALLPRYRSLLDLATHRLAVLTGAAPGVALDLDTARLPHAPELPDTGIPSDLLEQRPDIRAAFLRLRVAESASAVAKANRLPMLRLTGMASYESASLSTLFDSWILNLAASLTAPLLDGGGRRAEVDRTIAVIDERVAAYRATVLNAVREVEDALIQERHQDDLVRAIADECEAARKAWREADQRYRKGVIDYLPVLQALTAQQQLERELLTAQSDRLSMRVQLYRALGGVWTRDMTFSVSKEESGS